MAYVSALEMAEKQADMKDRWAALNQRASERRLRYAGAYNRGKDAEDYQKLLRDDEIKAAREQERNMQSDRLTAETAQAGYKAWGMQHQGESAAHENRLSASEVAGIQAQQAKDVAGIQAKQATDVAGINKDATIGAAHETAQGSILSAQEQADATKSAAESQAEATKFAATEQARGAVGAAVATTAATRQQAEKALEQQRIKRRQWMIQQMNTNNNYGGVSRTAWMKMTPEEQEKKFQEWELAFGY